MSRVDRRCVLGGLATSGLAFGLSLPQGDAQAAAVIKDMSQLKPGEFTWHPERSLVGQLAIVVSIPAQRVHVYRNGVRIAVSTCSTGKPGHSTPTGVFTILEKDKHHRSSTYNNAPMPNMNRLTWSGIAIHAGNLPGYPASHGCIRLPMQFSELLFSITQLGTPVILAGSASDPKEVVHPGLVLGDYATHEFQSVQAQVKRNELPWQAHVTRFAGPAAILISGADRTGTLLVDGAIVGQAPVVIRDPEVPLGSHVFTLKGTDAGQQGLAWHAIGYQSLTGVPAGQPESAILQRISTNSPTLDKVRQHLRPGLILTTTDLPARPDTRTGRDFVLMS